MAGFPTVDSIVNAWSVNAKGQKLFFHKLVPTVGVANTPHSLWAGGGIPVAGTYGTTGKANGRVITSASTGAHPYANPTGPATLHLVSFGCAPLAATATGTLLLVDRISDCAMAHAEATGTVTGMDATSRLGTGQGAQLFAYVTSALSAASNTINFTYTNQAGTGSKVTGNIVTVASAVANRSVNTALFQPLATGDTGIRSIQSITLVSGTATGTICYCLVRPLGSIPLPVASIYVERDFVVEVPNLERIRDSSCLDLILIPTGAAAASTVMMGEIRCAEN